MERQLFAFFHTLPDQAWVKDREGRYLLVNAAYEAERGLARDRILGRTDFELFPAEVAALFRADDLRVQSSGEWLVREEPVVGPAGETVFWETRKAPYRGPAGEVLGTLGTARDVSAFRRTEAARDRAELHYRRLLETSPCPIYLLDLEGRFLEVNPAASLLLGRPADELIGISTIPLLHPADRQPTIDVFLDLTGGERSGAVFEARLIRPDGEERLLEITASAVVAEGRIRAMQGIVRDITEERRSLLAVAERERQLAEAQAVARVGSWEWGLPGNQAVWSDEHFRLWGAEPGAFEPTLDRFMVAVHPDDQERVGRMMARAAAGERLPEFEYRIRRPDGGERLMVTRGEVQEDEAGIPLRAFGTVQDVTEQRATERALRDSEERFRRLVEGAPDPILVHEIDGRFVEVNDAACRLWGYSRAELLGMTVSELNPLYSPAQLEGLWPRLSEGGTHSSDRDTRAKDGRIVPVEAHMVGVREGDRRLVLCIVRDVTERRQLEDQLRQASRMEAVGRLAGGVAHDFNNMLLVITGFAALLRSEVERSAEASGYLAEIQRAATRSADLTRQLLAFGRRQMLKAEPLDLGHMVTDTARLLERVIPANVELAVERGNGLTPVFVDPGQLQQVILNLAINARDAMPGGGRLTLRTRSETVAHARPHRTFVLPAGVYALLEVEDTGEGIEPSVLQHVFEPFFTTKEVGRGTGLGLAMVHGTVSQSGGYVEVESTPGRGSRFCVFLPQTSIGGAPTPAPLAGAPPALGRGTVLLVEDEDAVRLLLGHTLRQAGYNVLSAADGEEALELAERHAPAIDLLLTDVVMPRMSGPELARQLHARWPRVAVIFMSGYSDQAVDPSVVHEVDAHFLQKPFALGGLVQVLGERMRG